MHSAKQPLDGSRALPLVLSFLCAAAFVCLGERCAGSERSAAARPKTRAGAADAPKQKGKANATLGAGEFANLWARLGSTDAPDAEAAAAKLVSAGDTAAAFLAAKFTEAAPDQQRIAKLIAELDADQHKTREAASGALRKAGLPAEPFLREALKATKSPEVQARVRELLADFARGDKDHPETRRYGRAVKVLTAIGSIEAFRATKALVAIAPTHGIRRGAEAARRDIAGGIVQSLLADARARSDAGDASTALKLCRNALRVAVEGNHYGRKHIQEIIDKLAAGAKVPARAWHDLRLLIVDGAKAVVLAVLTAMGKGDAEAGMKHVEAPAAVKEFLTKALTPMVQISTFMRAGEKAYGAKAWKEALAASELTGLADTVIPDAAEVAKTLKIERKDGKATATWEGNDEPWDLAKKDGVWKVVLAAAEAPPKEHQAEVLTQFKAIGAAAAGVQAKIGQPGVTAKQVVEALLKELQKVFGAPR